MATTPTPEPAAELDLPRTWFLTGDEVEATRAKIATLNSRARAKGFTGTVEIAAAAATRSYTPAPGAPPVIVYGFDVTITGSPPAYRGWLFLAAIDQLPSSQPGGTPGVIIRYPPGADQSIDNSDLRPGECDHCHTTRPRTTTYLVLHTDTGELMQVGRTCLKDFLGWSTTPVLLDTETIAADIERHLGSRVAAPWDLESVLTYAWAVVETYGWTPASAAGSRHATRDLVAEAMRGGRPGQEILASIAEHLDPAPHMAVRIIAELAPTLTGDCGYEANLAALLRSGRVDPAKHLGLAVSAVYAWHRLHERHRAAHQTRDEQRAEIRHAGQVGHQVTLTGTITTRIPVDGHRYDSRPQLLLVLDCGTAVAKMITSSAWAYDTKQGDQLTVTGMVKAHAEYRGIPQTVLVRPKRIDTPTDSQPLWETVQPARPQSRFQEAPLAAPAPLGRCLGI